MNFRLLAKVFGKAKYLAKNNRRILGQLHWSVKHPGISRKALVDKTCRIESSPGCKLQVYKNCVIRNGVQISLAQCGHIELQDQVSIRQNCYIESWGSLVIGHNSGLNVGCYVVALENIAIGGNVMIGPHVVIVDHDHAAEDLDIPMLHQGVTTSPITIQDDVWIGAHVTITKGVTIGRGAIIGANAVVTRDVPEYGVAVGIPARVVRSRQKEADNR